MRPKMFPTQDAVAGFEDGPSLPQPHCSAHLPGVVFWHVDHLGASDQTGKDQIHRSSNSRDIIGALERVKNPPLDALTPGQIQWSWHLHVERGQRILD